MVSLKQDTSISVEAGAVSPRISFSADFLNEDEGFISLIPNSGIEVNHERAQHNRLLRCGGGAEFEFRSIKPSSEAMSAADELFSDGRLLPISWHLKKLNEISVRTEEKTESGNKSKNNSKAEEIISSNAVSFCFLEDDPSPRPPRCTVLWKELLRLRKQRASSLSSSSSSSSSSSMAPNTTDTGKSKERKTSEEKEEKRVRKGMERSTRARSVMNAPTCSNGKRNGKNAAGRLD